MFSKAIDDLQKSAGAFSRNTRAVPVIRAHVPNASRKRPRPQNSTPRPDWLDGAPSTCAEKPHDTSKLMKHLSPEELLARTKNLVPEERKATVALIEHLAEINRRMLYTDLGYASLWEFATRELGLSEGAAQRRIQ